MPNDKEVLFLCLIGIDQNVMLKIKSLFFWPHCIFLVLNINTYILFLESKTSYLMSCCIYSLKTKLKKSRNDLLQYFCNYVLKETQHTFYSRYSTQTEPHTSFQTCFWRRPNCEFSEVNSTLGKLWRLPVRRSIALTISPPYSWQTSQRFSSSQSLSDFSCTCRSSSRYQASRSDYDSPSAGIIILPSQLHQECVLSVHPSTTHYWRCALSSVRVGSFQNKLHRFPNLNWLKH